MRKAWLAVLALFIVCGATIGVAKSRSSWTRVADDLDVVHFAGHGFNCVAVRGTAGMSAGAPALWCERQLARGPFTVVPD